MLTFLAKMLQKPVVVTLIWATIVGGVVIVVLRAPDTSGPGLNPQADYYRLPKGGHTLLVDADAGVLANDAAKPNWQTMTVTLSEGTLYGDVVLNQDGSFVYEPANCPECVTDRFQYALFNNGEFVAEMMAFINYYRAEPVAPLAAVADEKRDEEPDSDPTTTETAADSADSDPDEAEPSDDDADADEAEAAAADADRDSENRAQGFITIVNTTDKDYFFVATTRLLSDNGTLFRMAEGSPIPAYDIIDVPVTSDLPDAPVPPGNAEYVIPGLSLALQAEIYGLSGPGLTPVDYELPVDPDETEDEADASTTDDVAPFAQDDRYSTEAGAAIFAGINRGLLVNDSDELNRPLAVSLDSVSEPIHAAVFSLQENGSFLYTPDPDWSGTETFSYRAVADGSLSNLAMVTILTEASPVPPPAPPSEDEEAAAGDDEEAAAGDDEEAANDESDTDPADDDPPAADDGDDNADEPAADEPAADGDAEPVAPEPVLPGEKPVARDDRYEVTEKSSLGIGAYRGVLWNDYDPDLYSIRVVLPVEAPANSSLFRMESNGSFIYVPNDDFLGEDTFTYRVTDDYNGESEPAMVTINVKKLIIIKSGNTPPVQVSTPLPIGTTVDSPRVVSAPGLLAYYTDNGPDPLIFEVQTDPLHGTLSGVQSNGAFTYTPDSGYMGPDSFTYSVLDTQGGVLDALTAVLMVAPAGFPPTANDDYGWDYSVNSGDVLTLGAPGVLTNDIDPIGDLLQAVLVTDASNGDLTLSSNGSFAYTPDPGFVGTDTFTYRAFNGFEYSPTPATVTIVVSP
jgi:hypothetical protein